MAINTSLLISAAMLQDYLVDKDTGLPLVAGTVSLYQDNSRTTFKNWYYQTGVPGNYTYITLPNPLTLSAVGTIQDINGNDVIPFYYPYSEADNSTSQAYYVTVDSSTGERQFTRQNFPFVPPSSSSGNTNNTWQNYIYNNVFWRNCGSLTGSQFSSSASTISINSATFYSMTLAPSQHDGMTFTDFMYIKNQKDATETLTFSKFVSSFADDILTNDVTPEFYLNLNCTGAGTETSKFIMVPIQLHVDNFSGYTQASASIWAQNVGGGANNQITLKLFQYLGTGVTSPSAITLKTITTTNTWEKYTVNFSFPTSQSLSLSGAGDDGWYLQIGFPAATTCDINIAKPSIFLSQTQPTDEFQNYDEVEAIINSPRTGDIRQSLNAFYPFGWVPMNDGTIGNASSNSTARANIDTWPLFNLLWNLFSAYTHSTTNDVCQMYNSSGVAVAYGASAYADFNANNRLGLTAMLGRVLMGSVPISALLANSFSQTFTASNSGGNLLLTCASTNSPNMFVGMPITFTNSGGGLPGNLAANEVFYVSTIANSTTFYVSTSYANALAGTLVAYSSAGTGTQTFYTGQQGIGTGQYDHTLLQSELPDPLTSTATVSNVGAGGIPVIQSNTTYGAGIVSNQGGGNSHNIVQLANFANMYIKL